ncbi:heparin lyase I family protein [Kitasatospora sp. NPDC051914]|uniref:heparin lyase I family protein n=1 Tax=Kitasatospora sp. NPDC051914 TaxID=3154945 RepID=UPI00341564B5
MRIGRARTLLLGTVTAAVVLVATAVPGQASITFQNAGTLAGWDSVGREHLGTVDQVAAPALAGSEALKFTQTYDPAWTGRYHSEVTRKGVAQRGTHRYYSYAFRLSDDWEFAWNSGSVMQMITVFKGCSNWVPTFMDAVENDDFLLHLRTGDLCAPTTTKFRVAKLERGKWYRVVHDITFASDNTGRYRVFLNGTQVFSRTGRPNMVASDSPMDWRVGLYMGSWAKDARGFQGTQKTKTAYIDQARVSSTWAEANGWFGSPTTPPTSARPTTAPPTGAPTGASAWAPGTAYRAGDQVSYGGQRYRCTQAHTSQTGWEPPNAPALWQRS